MGMIPCFFCYSILISLFLPFSFFYLPVSSSPEFPKPSEIPYFNISSDLSEKEGLDRLLNRSRYDNRSIPPSHETLRVSVSVLLLTLASPDESSLKYEVEFLLNLAWSDPRLRYTIINETGALPTMGPNEPYNYDAMPMRLNHKKRPFLDALHHHDQVWKPDVYYVKHGDFRQNLDPTHLALRIYPNGTINFTTRRHLILSCKGNLPFFPFDDPHCDFCVESVSYERDRLIFHWQGEKGVLRESKSLSKINAYLERNTTSNCESRHERGDYSCLKVELVFARDRAFYFTTVFIPDIILVTSSFITFWLEWNAVPARIMLGVTTMLNFFTTSNSFRATLPVVSDLTAMNVWDGFSMFFIYASLLEFVFVNYIGRKRPKRLRQEELSLTNLAQNKIEVTPNEVNLLSSGGGGGTQIVACTACSPSPTSHPVNNSCSSSLQPQVMNFINQPLRQRIVENPIGVAKTIDVVSRIVFPTAYAIFVIFFFVRHGALQQHFDSS